MSKGELGKNSMSDQLYMAPLRGFTDQIYRNLFSEHFGGFDRAVAPFIASTSGKRIRPKYARGLLPENNAGMPVVPQILSKSAKDFIALANCLLDMGYDTINWNVGCPYPQVTKKMRGSGLLPHADRIQAFLDEVVPSMWAMGGQLSIKTRLGQESRDDLVKLAPIFNQYPLEEVIIHARTAVQMYEGNVDLEGFEACLSILQHPVVYNGDIRSAEDLRVLSERFSNVNRWMIGRWSLVNPFLPGLIKTGQDAMGNKVERLKRFHDALYEHYAGALCGSSHLLNRMKAQWNYLSLSFRDCGKTVKKIRKSNCPEHYVELVSRFFETEAVWKEGENA